MKFEETITFLVYAIISRVLDEFWKKRDLQHWRKFLVFAAAIGKDRDFFLGNKKTE